MQVKGGGSWWWFISHVIYTPVCHHGIVMVIIRHCDCENSPPDRDGRQHLQLDMHKFYSWAPVGSFIQFKVTPSSVGRLLRYGM